MAVFSNSSRRKSTRNLIVWLLDRLAAFFERLAALTTDPELKLYIPNAMVVCIYKDASREIELWVGEAKNCISRSEWNKIVSELSAIADGREYVFLDKNRRRICVILLASDSVEFRFHAMTFDGVVRARRCDLARSFTKYRAYVDAEEKR